MDVDAVLGGTEAQLIRGAQWPGQGTIVGETYPPRLRAVHAERARAFLGKLDQLGRAALHPIRHLVGGNASGDLRVSGLSQPFGVKVTQDIEGLPLAASVD